MSIADDAAAYEAITFTVTNVGVKEKAGSDPTGYVELKSTTTRGISRIKFFGEESLQNEYKVGEHYEMTLKMVQAKPQSHGNQA
jgi:hypothetical protein